MLASYNGHEISTLYHSLSWYTRVTLVYTTLDYGITYSYCLSGKRLESQSGFQSPEDAFAGLGVSKEWTQAAPHR